MGMGGGGDDGEANKDIQNVKKKRIIRPIKLAKPSTGPNLKTRPNPKTRKSELKGEVE